MQNFYRQDCRLHRCFTWKANLQWKCSKQVSITALCIFREKGKKQMDLTFLYGDAGFAILEQTNPPVSFPVSESSLHGMAWTGAENKARTQVMDPAICRPYHRRRPSSRPLQVIWQNHATSYFAVQLTISWSETRLRKYTQESDSWAMRHICWRREYVFSQTDICNFFFKKIV